ASQGLPLPVYPLAQSLFGAIVPLLLSYLYSRSGASQDRSSLTHFHLQWPLLTISRPLLCFSPIPCHQKGANQVLFWHGCNRALQLDGPTFHLLPSFAPNPLHPISANRAHRWME